MQTHNRPLTFRLRASARYHCLPDGKAALVLLFPLRAVFIHAFWHPVLACLGHDEWVPLERIAEAVPHVPPEQIELFLNTLIQKGISVYLRRRRGDDISAACGQLLAIR